ncbi:hypothetical protein JIQ42_08238 [Leishmania sp. Namibia]|uniref:hypothetical protein n=1 Tax=Leishmania sp. Namibia TaxID=2802991 RepID=UPI001B58264F|nr:hypothetical protein JIQ42_08238 [Leishmania sp. Namibia]
MSSANGLKGDTTHEPIRASSNTELRQFHEKYSGLNTQAPPVGKQEISYAQKQASVSRVRALKAKRQRLRELQEWEYQQATAPRRCANPGPLGLLGFGLSTILLNLHNTGSFPLSTVIVAMGICLGGGAQFIAGLLEWVRGNTFAYVAFTAYGVFWLSLVCVWLLPNTAAGTSTIVMPASEYFVGAYLFLWGVFSFVMLICTIRMNVAIFLVFLTVTLLFMMLGGANMTNNTTALHAAGYEGIICGSLALYLAFAEILSEVWDRTILPVIPMTQVLGWLGASEKPAEAVELKNSVHLPKDDGSD